MILRLLFDFGMVVLIWLVQLIIYPAFANIAKSKMVCWHQSYTENLGFVVIPLMFVQLGVIIYQTFLQINLYTIASLLVVITLWIITFTLFVPLHNKVAKGNFSESLGKNLIATNWIRTFLWTLLFILNGMIIF